MVESINTRNTKPFLPGQKEEVSFKERFAKLYMTGRAYVMRVESWCRAMDGGDGGVFWTYVFKPIADAAARYRVKNNELQKKFLDLLTPMQERWDQVRDIEAPELGYTFKRKSELIGALMHIGNASNKEKLLLGGRGENAIWADVVELANGETIVSYERWERFFARAMREGIITKEDMDFVQSVWDLLEETKEMSQKAFHTYYGYYFEEVPATPVLTPWGMCREVLPVLFGQKLRRQVFSWHGLEPFAHVVPNPAVGLFGVSLSASCGPTATTLFKRKKLPQHRFHGQFVGSLLGQRFLLCLKFNLRVSAGFDLLQPVLGNFSGLSNRVCAIGSDRELLA